MIYIIRFIHFLVLGFFTVSPFSKNILLLILHFISTPFLYAHWKMNNDQCFLTALEKYFRKVDDNRSFMYSVIAPVYNIPQYTDKDIYYIIQKVLFVLWAICIYNIKNIYDKRTNDTKEKIKLLKKKTYDNKFKIIFGIIMFFMLSGFVVNYVLIENHRMYLIEH